MRAALVIIAGLVVGANLVILVPDRWLVRDQRGHAHAQVWACPMRCARLDHPGTCPVCGMVLEPLAADGEQVMVSDDQATLLELATAAVRRRRLVRPIRTGGVVELALGETPALAAQAGRALSVKVELFERDLFWIAVGQDAEVAFDLAPGQRFHGTVASVATTVKPETRSTTAWISVDAAGAAIRTGAFATVVIGAVLGEDGQRPTVSLAGRYTCRLHPQIHADEAGACPVCGLPLAIDPRGGHGDRDDAGGDEAAGPHVLAIPRDAVVATGGRQVVYVRGAGGGFAPRDVTIGARAGDWVAVRAGLSEGEVVVTRGAFFLASHLELTGPR